MVEFHDCKYMDHRNQYAENLLDGIRDRFALLRCLLLKSLFGYNQMETLGLTSHRHSCHQNWGFHYFHFQ